MKHMLLFIFLLGTGSLHAAAEDSYAICLGSDREYNDQTYGLPDLLQKAETGQDPQVCFSIAQRYDALNDTELATVWYAICRDLLLDQPKPDFNVCNMLTKVYRALGDTAAVLAFAQLARDYAQADKRCTGVIYGLRHPRTYFSSWENATFRDVLGKELSSRCALAEYYVDQGFYKAAFDELRNIKDLLLGLNKRALFDDVTVRDIMCRIYCIKGLTAEQDQRKCPQLKYHRPLRILCCDKDHFSRLVPDADSKMASAKHALFPLAGHLLYRWNTTFPKSLDLGLSSGFADEIYAKLFTSSVSNDDRSFQVAHAVHTFKKRWPERFERAQAMAKSILDQSASQTMN